jgi:hypothetical protein
MIDALDIKTFIEANWNGLPLIGTDPLTNLILRVDEYDPRNPKYQVVVMNRPIRETFLCPNGDRNIVRMEQDIQIEVHVKYTRYDEDTVTSMRADFVAIKTELNRIINKYRYDTVGRILHISSWADGKITHGYGIDKEPLGIVSRMVIHILWYEGN